MATQAEMVLIVSSRQMVEGLTQMTIERLQLYLKKNKRLPDRIIVYRDGVSEVRTTGPSALHVCMSRHCAVGPVLAGHPARAAEATGSVQADLSATIV